MVKAKSRIEEMLMLDFAAALIAAEDAAFLYGTQAHTVQWQTTEHTARYLRGIVPLQQMRAKRAKRRGTSAATNGTR